MTHVLWSPLYCYFLSFCWFVCFGGGRFIMQDLSSQTRERTHAPCSGSAESEPLAHQGGPCTLELWVTMTKVERSKCSLTSVLPFFIPMDCSPPGSPVHEISQARILEWVAISFSRESSWPRGWTCISWVSCIGRWILYHWATWEAP